MGRPLNPRYNSNPANAGHRITATANLGSGNVTAYVVKQLSNYEYLFSTGGGSGATATATVSGGAVTGVTVTAAGTGYHQAPHIAFYNGYGSGAVAGTVTLKAVSATVVNAGTGGAYVVNNTITLTNGVVLTVASVSGSQVATVTVTTPGSFSGALTANPVAQSSSSGSGTGATFNLFYGINTIAVSAGGSGYSFAPNVQITDATTSAVCKLVQGSPAAANQAQIVVTPFWDGTATGTTTISGGAVTAVNITYGGSGYTSAPAITFGSGAASATAVITQFVDHINVTNAGSGYVEPPVISFSGGGGGTGATAIAQLTGYGQIANIVVTNGGSGYTSAPGVVITPTVGGTSGAATAVTNGKVTSITSLSGGSGYVTAPSVSFAAPAGSATAENAKFIMQSTVKTFEGHEYRWSTAAPTKAGQASINLT